LIEPGQPIAEVAKKRFSELFQEPLTHKSIAAARLADDDFSRAAAAMATAEATVA
jgi:hypothetical protein